MEQRSVRTLRSTCFSIASIPPQLLTDSQRRDFWRRLPRNQPPLSLCWEDWRCVRPYGNECRAEHLREPSATLILCHHNPVLFWTAVVLDKSGFHIYRFGPSTDHSSRSSAVRGMNR